MHQAPTHRDDLDSAGRSQLHREQPDTAAATKYQQAAGRAQRQPGHDLIGGPGGQRGGGHVGERCAGIDPGEESGVDDGQLRVPVAAIGEVRHRHDPVAGGQAGHPWPDTLDDSGDVVAEDARHLQACPAAVGPSMIR